MNYDLIVIGSGPGGYVAAIRASQLKMKVAIVERAEVGGICLNWGCIPTKALLKSAQVFNYAKHAANYGISIEGEVKADFEAVIKRSRTVAEMMSKGVQFLLKKNNVDVINGFGKIVKDKKVEVTQSFILQPSPESTQNFMKRNISSWLQVPVHVPCPMCNKMAKKSLATAKP